MKVWATLKDQGRPCELWEDQYRQRQDWGENTPGSLSLCGQISGTCGNNRKPLVFVLAQGFSGLIRGHLVLLS